MPAVRQLPAKLDLECIAGDPFTVTITATGVTTLTSPAVTMTSAAGDAFTTDPGIPTASVAGLAVTSAWSTADTAALNTGTRAKSYRYSVAANPDSAGLFEIVAGTLTVHPVGHAGTSSASSATLAVTVGTTAVSLAVALGGGGGGGGGATTLDDLTDVTITSATNGQVLKYNGSVWVNGTDATGGDWSTPLLVAVESTTSDTISAGDAGYFKRYTNASLTTVTFPTDGAEDLVDGFTVTLYAEGAAGLTIVTSGLTATVSPAPTALAQGETLMAVKTSTANTWVFITGAATTYQPLDSDLTAIAALTTTSFGRSLLTAANAAALPLREEIIIPIGDETTAITTGTAKVTFRMPFALTVTAVRASLTTASSSGTPTFDINDGGTTILSTKLTIDANEKTSTTAATAAVISDTALADDAEITIDVDTAGTGAAGAKITIIGTRA
jgi:hypothetical protein